MSSGLDLIMDPRPSLVEKGFTRKRSKSIVAAVKSFFGRQLSVQHEEAAVAEDQSDSSTKLSSHDPNKTNEEAWMQACYNSIAILFLFITGCILLAVYYILEPFLHPLLWAVLVGMVLHPFKHMSTSGITQWLKHTRKSGVPLSLAAVFTPLFLFNWLSCRLENVVLRSWRKITGLAVGVIALLLMYMLDCMTYVFQGTTVIIHCLDFMESLFTAPLSVMLVTLTIGFLFIVFIRGQDTRQSTSLQVLSSIIWYLAMLNLLTYLLGSIAFPLVTTLYAVAGVLTLTWKKPVRSSIPRIRTTAEPDSNEPTHYLDVLPSVSSLCDEAETSNDETLIEMETAKNDPNPQNLNPQDSSRGSQDSSRGSQNSARGSLVHRTTSAPEASSTSTAAAVSADNVGETSNKYESVRGSVSFGSTTTIKELPVPAKEQQGKAESSSLVGQRRGGRGRPRKLQTRENSNAVFVVLLIAYFIVICWHYPFILFVLSPLALWALVKHALSLSSTLASRTINAVRRVVTGLKERAWLVAPPPLPMVMRVLLKADSTILKLAVRSTGSLVSAFIIIGLVVGVAAMMAVFLLKVQVELTHYMTVGAKVWNMTVTNNPQLSGLMSNETSFEMFAKQGYEYGRVWLAEKLHSLVGDSKDGISLVEKQILDLFDDLYHSYFLSTSPNPNPMEGVWHNTPDDGELFEEVKDITLNNLSTILEMLESLGAIISDNFSVAFSFLYALMQILFSGGSVLVNLVVFVSTLFYLLSWSGKQYLPVQWVMNLLPHLTPPTDDEDGEEVAKEPGETFQRTIRSVFHASLRRAFFYGLYTWLTHTILAIPVTILPSVLAGIAGGVPFVGPYWASLPAILELWLVENSPSVAIALLVLTLFPMLFIDSLINGEIEGGHPYLTGLAIAGGIYFAGLEGALIGPILLCCLLFFMDIYGDIFSY